MHVAILLTGRAGSKSVTKKNVYPVLGRPLAWYAMSAAKESNIASEVWISTDCPDLLSLAKAEGINTIVRPQHLAEDNSELPDAIEHALQVMGNNVDILVTMHCNCCVHRPGLVDECIEKCLGTQDADSCVSGYIDKSVHPFRTKMISTEGYLEPWLQVPDGTSNNRQSLPSCFILDGAVRAMKVSRCFPPNGQKPFTYLGNKIIPLENGAVGDVHSLVDIKISEIALKELGWQEV